MKYSLWQTKTLRGLVYDEQVAMVNGEEALQVARQMFPAASVEPVLTAEELDHLTWMEMGKNDRHI